ncbi:hypothetical protein CNR22_06650 [Sphingobacteriaceae bacterium]|nr:hypothetical protein CNR22_06650 [Sphingobacteriaceae bacterium]
MIKRVVILLVFFFFLSQENHAQFLYYKSPDSQTVSQFRDSANRVNNIDSNSLLRKQFNYVLKFYPKMRVKTIQVKYTKSSTIAVTKPKFGSIFKLPHQRSYTIYFSKQTKTTMDSVLLNNLSFNAQLGMIANQVSVIEDMATGGFFNFIGWYFKHLGRKGKKEILQEAEQKTLEVGLGYQLLAYNKECEEKLQISNWQSTKGYGNYFKHYRNMALRPQKVSNFMTDLPVYVSNNYK